MHLLIYKKFFISGSSNHFLEGSLTKKLKSQKIFLVRDPFKKWLFNDEIQNFPLMPLLIYKKKFCWGQSEQQLFIFILLVKLTLGQVSPAHRGDPRPKLLWVVNPTHGWVKPPKSRQNLRYGPSPCVSLTRGHSVNICSNINNVH